MTEQSLNAEDLAQKSEEELHVLLHKLETQLNGANDRHGSSRDRQEHLMALMHEYNDIKDATQIILGVLANMQGVMLKQVHEDYELPLKEE